MSNYLWYLQCVLHLDQVAANLAADVAALDHADFLRHGEGQHVVNLVLTSFRTAFQIWKALFKVNFLGETILTHAGETSWPSDPPSF